MPSFDRYRLIFERSPQALLLIDPKTATVVEANPAARSFYADVTDSLVGARLWELNGMEPELALEMAKGILETPGIRLETHRRPPLPPRDVEIYAGPIELDGATLLFSISHDITERARTERQNQRLFRLAMTLASLNEMIGAADGETEVWRATARTIAVVAEVPAVFVGLVEPAARALRIVAAEGDDASVAGGIEATIGSLRPEDPGLTRLMQTGRAQILGMQPPLPSDIQYAVEHIGVRSAAAIPIAVGGFAVGVIGLLAREDDYFGEAEVSMLDRMGAMVGARLGDLDRVERGNRMTAALQAERERSEQFAVAMAQVDRALGRLTEPSSIYQEMCRLPVAMGICALAWIGIVETGASSRRLRTAASAGDAPLPESNSHQMWANPGNNPAMPLSETMVCDDLLDDPRFRARRSEYERAGLRSTVALPLYVGARLAGGFALYAREAGAFGPDRVALLERLVANAGMRLAVLECEERSRAAEEKAARLLRTSPSNAPHEPGPKS